MALLKLLTAPAPFSGESALRRAWRELTIRPAPPPGDLLRHEEASFACKEEEVVVVVAAAWKVSEQSEMVEWVVAVVECVMMA